MTDDFKPTAVLVVHGIGQQMPMDTLRRLVTTVFGRRPDGSARQIFSKVDRESQFLDLRRLVLPAGEGRGRVDFYEVYWAPTLSGGTAATVISWAAKLLVRRPVGKQMSQIVWTLRGTLVASLLSAALLYYLLRDTPWLRYLAPIVPVLLAVRPIIRGWGKSMLTETLADASRWFAPQPRDIPERDRVRQIGLELLTELHRLEPDGEQRYGRIVVFGHSLGSVIAYDVLRLAFDKLRFPTSPSADDAERPVAERQAAAWNFERQREVLTSNGDLSRFQYFQRQLHAEQRAHGVPWLVTDLVTAGSPIAHARDLWSSEVATFDDRVNENEYPICPPLGEVQRSEVRRIKAEKLAIPGAKGKIAFYRKTEAGPLIAHESAPFASTRWTNLYFPLKPWLGGDPVGGKLAETMGPGVRDVAVRPSTKRRRVLAMPVAAHTWYWRRDREITEDDARVEGGHPDAVLQLRRVLDLKPGRVRPYESTEPSAHDSQ